MLQQHIDASHPDLLASDTSQFLHFPFRPTRWNKHCRTICEKRPGRIWTKCFCVTVVASLSSLLRQIANLAIQGNKQQTWSSAARALNMSADAEQQRHIFQVLWFQIFPWIYSWSLCHVLVISKAMCYYGTNAFEPAYCGCNCCLSPIWVSREGRQPGGQGQKGSHSV